MCVRVSERCALLQTTTGETNIRPWDSFEIVESTSSFMYFVGRCNLCTSV